MENESSSRGRSEHAFDEIAQCASSSRQQPQQTFDVFINHRGPDVKATLASTIYHVLGLQKVKGFFDREEIDLGDLIPQAIENAMRSALIHIAIFSKDYATSPWCLAELLFMHEKTRAPIIPIFYDVEPVDLKWGTRGLYADAFSKHEEHNRYSLETLAKWKNALHQVASLDGYVFKSNRDDEGILLKTVVNRVTREIMKVNLPFSEPGHPVGLDKAVEDFETFLESARVHEGAKKVGIVGMTGCGKTTLARKFCNLRYSDFDSYSFLSDVRKAALLDLQKKLFWDLLHRDTPPLKDANELQNILATRLRILSPRVLIVLDDVDHLDLFCELFPDNGKSLESGSLIIVISGDQSILQRRGFSIYKMNQLDPSQAEELFCWHAFLETTPPAAFKDLVQNFIKACDRLPLFIEVIAGMLYGKLEGEWRSKLKEIRRLNRKEIQKLTPIYDALDDEEKYIFLDVACFFVGEKINLAIAVWDADGREGLETLMSLLNKCLVAVDKKNRIRMNDILRDLGRQIAIKSWPPRLWYPGQINRVIECREPTTSIRGIMAATTQIVARSGRYEFPECCNSYKPPFQECMDLRIPLNLLVVDRHFFKSDFARLSENLVWLRWFNFKHSNVPSWLSLTKLRVLELYGVSRLKDLWKNDAHPPEELREMTVTASEGDIFDRFPSRIANLKHLTKIALISYHGEGFRFKKLPDEFCDLQSLEHLELRHCKLLSTLPSGFGKLEKLRHLDLCSCQRLWKLPDSFKDLVNLEYLDLSGCAELAPEPDIVISTRNLKNLYLSGCLRLQVLPVQIAEQKFLRELHLKNTMVRDVPDNIDQLSKLETLVIGIPHLTSFPPLGNLFSLTRLKITGCTNLESFTGSVERLNCLEYLCIKSSKFRSLPEGFTQLNNLQKLKIFDCPIAELDFGSGSSSLGELKVIHLKGTYVTRLSISQDFCPKLETLQLEQNYSLTEMDIFSESVKLVKVYECTDLLYVNGIRDRENPITFEITGCPGLDPDTITAPTRPAVLIHSRRRFKCLQMRCCSFE